VRSGMFEPTESIGGTTSERARVSLYFLQPYDYMASGGAHAPTRPSDAALPIHRAPITAAGAQAVPREKLQPAALLLRLASRVEHRTRWAPCP